MDLRRILLISDHPLIAEAIRSLVEKNANLKVIGVEPPSEETLAKVRTLRPDIVVLCDDEESPSTACTSLLDVEPQMRVIRLATDGNTIHIYDGHQVAARNAQDLVDALSSFMQSALGSVKQS
jgi:DNA-binding NarL/FixJ family response regulator